MHNFLAKCAILALLAGGFAFTGDATRLLRRGRGILDATTVPNAAPASEEPTPPSPAPEATTPSPDVGALVESVAPGTVGGTPEASPETGAGALADRVVGSVEPSEETAVPAAPSPAPARPVDAPVGAPIATTIPGGGPQSVRLAGLAPGDRVIVWIGKPSGRGRATMVAFDIVDPATGDAIELRHASGAENQATLAPFRRVRIAGSVGVGFLGNTPVDPGRIECRKSLCLEALDGPAGGDARRPPEPTGPVVAIAITSAGTAPARPAAPASAAPTPAPAGSVPGGQPAA